MFHTTLQQHYTGLANFVNSQGGLTMEEKAKIKKPFYKRWWVWAIVVVLAIGMFGSSGDTETKGDDQQSTAQSQTAY